MKITKRQLRRIIKEEKKKILKEFGAGSKEIMNPLVEFSQAWSGLGGAVQSQMIDLINSYVQNDLEDAVYEINPNAFDLAVERLRSPLNMLSGEDAEDLKDMFEQVEDILRDMR